MADEPDNAPSAASNRLPSLPKKRTPGPFHRLEELSAIVDPPQDLRLQARRDPSSGGTGGMSNDHPIPVSMAAPPAAVPDRRDGLSDPALSDTIQKPEHMVLQTTVPIDKAQAFKMHCIRNRTTVREELRRLVDQVVATPRDER